MNTLNTASIIRDQIGQKALFMIGAKNLAAEKNSLSFRIGRNSKQINHIKITLNDLDLYDIEYGQIRKHELKIKSESTGLYFDMMRKDIEENTGLYTSL